MIGMFGAGGIESPAPDLLKRKPIVRYEREDLLRKLEAVSPGLAIKEAVEQSSCFVFRAGRVITFNDEIACSIACDIGFEGAVAAKPLIDLLSKMSEKVIDIGVEGDETEIMVKGKRRRAGITMEAQIALPVDSVEPPKKWREIGHDFADAISVVQQCASKDTNNFHLTCIHMTPDCVEACDNFQVVRYPVETGLKAPCLVKKDSIKHVTGLGMTEVSETKTWIHYRNPSGLQLSVRREVMDFEDIDHILDMDGIPTTLPGGLAEAVEKAEIFSGENADNNLVTVTFRADQLSIRGEGASGWYEERKDVKWEGEPIKFSMAPKLLVAITAKTNDCSIAPGRLKIDSGKFTYVTCLGKVD